MSWPFAPAARVDHQRVGLHQLLDDVHRLIQQAAGIRTQIQHQAVRARDPQLVHRSAHLGARVLREVGEPQVSGVVSAMKA